MVRSDIQRLRKHGLRAAIRAHPRVHSGALALDRARRRAFESFGSDRYSHPALDDLDRKLAGYLPEREGIFVEAGAFDGYGGSNTYWFERFRDWSGVLIEPTPELAERARRERPRSQVFQCALVPPDYADDHITLYYGGGMSVVAGTWNDEEEEHAHAHAGALKQGRETFLLEAPARMLSDVLDEASITHVDLLSLDVEGYEASALRGLDLTRHAPRFLLVEMLKEEQARPAIEAILGAHYRHEAQLSIRDHLYERVV
jgi:FkbM family methyltransferase